MLRSMFSGVSGLRLHQTRMDVIGNNIANVNTTAFKSSRVTFQEVFSQTLKPASSPAEGGGRGGTNPFQVGLGISIASIDSLHMNGGVQRTDKATDLAIEGDGFFAVSDGSNMYYTRDGNFDLDLSGNLVTASGLKVMGWLYNPATQSVETTGEPTEINLANMVLPPKATTSITFEGNLSDRLDIGDSLPYTVNIFDAKGAEHKLTYTFTKSANNVWNYTVTAPPNMTVAGGMSGVLSFNQDGSLIPMAMPPLTVIAVDNSIPPINIDVEFNPDKFTQYDESESTVKAALVDGYRAGVLNGINIDSNGDVVGIYSNGQFHVEATLAIAKFTNPGGLERMGGNLFRTSTNSGIPELGIAGEDGRGTINPGALEMSNVDLAREFTDMITTQRGFQASSRIITTSDEMLQELVNLKR
jgi:flagellar hook protein FlgE